MKRLRMIGGVGAVAVAAAMLHRGASRDDAATATPRAIASATPAAAVSVTTPTLVAEDRARWTMATLDEIFDAEARDDAWAAALETEIRGVKTDPRLGGVTSLEVECRSTMCRVIVALDAAHARRTLHALTVTPPLNTSGFHGIDPDDDRKLRLFVSRSGTALQENPAFVQAAQARGG